MTSKTKSQSINKKPDNSLAIRAISEVMRKNVDNIVISKKLLTAVIASSITSLIGVCMLIYVVGFQPTKYLYLAVTPDHKIIQIIPTSDPYYSNAAVGNAATSAVNYAFNFSYINMKSHFRSLLDHGFNSYGLSNLVSSLNNNGIMEEIKKKKLFVKFSSTTAPFISARAVYINPFTKQPTVEWVVTFNGVITYTNNKEEASKTNTYKVTVVRVPSFEAGPWLRVTNVVAENVSSNNS